MKRTRTYVGEDEDKRIEITIKQERKVAWDGTEDDEDERCERFFDGIRDHLSNQFHHKDIKTKR